MAVVRKRWTTASKLDRGALCPASTVRPETRSEPGKPAIWGNGAHKFIETGVVPEGPDTPAWVTKGLKDKIASSGFKREDWYPPGAHETQAYLDGPNLDQVSIVIDKQYPELPSSIRFKIDYVGEYQGLPWIEDLKTGRFPVPPTALQVAAAALLVKQLVGSKGAFGSVLHWPRYPKHALPNRERAPFSADDLKAVRDRLLLMRDISLSKNPPAIPGDEQCRYCDCFASCPEGQEFRARSGQ